MTTATATDVVTPAPWPAPSGVESMSGPASGKHHTLPPSTIAQPVALPYAVEPEAATSDARR